MAIPTRTGLFAVLLLLATTILPFASPAAASTDSPFLLAHKKTSLTRLKSGAEQITVSIDIYNQGSATAYDVSLNDDTWPKDTFTVVSGSPSKSWDKLDTGAIVSHSFVLESTVKGIFQGAPAVIKFRIPTKAALQEAYSTPILPLDILAEKPQVKKLDLLKSIVAKYGSQVSVILIVLVFAYLVASPSKSNKKRR